MEAADGQPPLQKLKDLAHDKNIKDSGKLYQYAKAKGIHVTTKLASDALKGDIKANSCTTSPL